MNKRTRPLLTIAFTPLILLGCSTVEVNPMSMRPAKPAKCKLDKFINERDIEQPYDVACIISSQTDTTLMHDKTASAAIENVRADACGCGADALLVETAKEEGITLMTWGQGQAQLKAIRYLD